MHSPTLSDVTTLPYALHMTIGPAMCYGMFRLGPQVVFHRVHFSLLLYVVLVPFPVATLAYIGPLHTVPLKNRMMQVDYSRGVRWA